VRRAPRRAAVLRLIPPVLSLLVLGAHAFRAGSVVVVALLALTLALLLVPRRWATRVVQVVLVLGTVEWLMTLAQLVFERSVTGEPVARLVLILAGVAGFTAASTLVFRSAPLRAFYRRRPRPVETDSGPR
jgi:hypothetical protein